MPVKIARPKHQLGFRDVIFNVNDNQFYTDAPGDQFKPMLVESGSNAGSKYFTFTGDALTEITSANVTKTLTYNSDGTLATLTATTPTNVTTKTFNWVNGQLQSITV